MPDIVDIASASQTAVFEALNGRAALTALSEVFDHVPEGTQPPMTIVGNIEVENIGSKAEPIEQVTAEVITVYRGPGRDALLAIMHQQKLAIEAGLSQAGVHFGPARRLMAASDGPAQDGITHAGLSIFTFTAEPA